MTSLSRSESGGFDILEYLRANWQEIACQSLSTMSEAAFYAAITSQYSALDLGKEWSTVKLAADAAILLAGCNRVEPLPDDPFYDASSECVEVTSEGTLFCKVQDDRGITREELSTKCQALRIVAIESVSYSRSRCTWQTKTGDVRTTEWYSPQDYGAKFTWYIQPCEGSYCKGSEPEFTPPSGDIGEPIEIIPDPAVECRWTVTPIESYVDTRGVYHTKYSVKPSPSSCGEDYYYWDTDGGPYISPPYDPRISPPNSPTTTNIPRLPGFEYYMYGTCEKAEDWGEDPDGFEQPILEFYGREQDGILGLAARLDAIGEMLAWTTLLKLQTCGCDQPKLEGRWVTSQWISEENSPNSGIRLRKLLRWRTKSSRTDAELAEFFKDFWWDAGPYCVKHVGGWWGTPQVWASTVLEGQRVIKEIAREAGIDPDLEGQWESSISRNPRFGMTGRMRLRRLEGHPWISSRDGSDMLPMG